MDQIMFLGEDGGRLAEFIMKNLDDEDLDQVEVTRKFAESRGNYNEPITVGALLTFAGGSVLVVGRLVERWMELENNRQQMRLVLEAYRESAEAGKTLGDIAKTGLKVTETRQPMDPSQLIRGSSEI